MYSKDGWMDGWMDIRLLAWLCGMCVIIQSSWLFIGYLVEYAYAQRERKRYEYKDLASVLVAPLCCCCMMMLTTCVSDAQTMILDSRRCLSTRGGPFGTQKSTPFSHS